MPNTTKKDHKERAIATIQQYISNPTNIADWKSDDLKTAWIVRAKHIGVDGYSAHLKDAFTGSVK